MNLDYVRRAFVVFNGFDGPDQAELWWRTDGEFEPLTLFVRCSDLFFADCADAERLTDANIQILEEALRDAIAAGPALGAYAGLLFCARMRRMRPQGAQYMRIPEPLHPLFDACGPERQASAANPVAARP